MFTGTAVDAQAVCSPKLLYLHRPLHTHTASKQLRVSIALCAVAARASAGGRECVSAETDDEGGG